MTDKGVAGSRRLTVEERWEQGVPHHPTSKSVFNELRKADEEVGDNGLDLRYGGDGDNGEHLMYLLDDLIERGVL